MQIFFLMVKNSLSQWTVTPKKKYYTQLIYPKNLYKQSKV